MDGLEGRIIRGIGGFYYVTVGEDSVYECRARGLFRKDGIRPVVGDYVRIRVVDEAQKQGNIEELLPRRNTLIRPLSANVDQAMVVFACTSPEPNIPLLDRFLIMLRSQEIPCILVWNKKDLVSGERLGELMRIYRGADVEVCAISAKQSADMEELHGKLFEKTTILAGPSGVGKSTILNGCCTGAGMDTGEISAKLKRGKHTTRHAEIFPVGKDGYLMDTPGFTAFSLEDMKESEIKAYYPEFYSYEGSCRFQPCSHIHEPGCAVQGAVDAGEINRQRYEGYCAVFLEQKKNAKMRY